MTRISHISYRLVVRPMKTTFATSLGSKKAATSVLVTVRLSDGSVGVGEVPTSFVMPHETVEAIRAILRGARPTLAGIDIDDYPQVLHRLRGQHAEFHMTLAGLEVALFRASLAAHGKSELAYWGGRQQRIETDITISFVPDGQVLERWLRRVTAAGFGVYKIKVSGDVQADLKFLAAADRILRESLGRRAPVVRLDGNQGYTARSYVRMVRALEKARFEFELFEQPLHKHDYAGLRKIRRCGQAPVILDETVFCAADCRRVIDQDLGGGVNIKVAKSGIAESAAILKLARSAGLKLMIGCMTETMVGLSAGLRLAAGSGAFDYIDLDSIHFLHHRRVCEGIAIDGPRYLLESAP